MITEEYGVEVVWDEGQGAHAVWCPMCSTDIDFTEDEADAEYMANDHEQWHADLGD